MLDRRRAFVVGLAVALVGASARPGTQADGLQLLRSWLDAVGQHVPGRRDPAVARVASWSDGQLDAVFPYIKALTEFLREPALISPRRAGRSFPRAELAALSDLANGELRRGDMNRVLKRGAILHADAVIVARSGETSPLAGAGGGTPANSRGRSADPRLVVLVSDGQYEAVAVAVQHWAIGRTLLDAVTPTPEGDATVRDWYHATAAFLAEYQVLAESEVHLGKARQILPDDAGVLLASGCLHETLGAPSIQSAVQSIVTSGSIRVDVASAGTNRDIAERYFRRALAIDPESAEARLRLARLLSLKGRYDQALTELQRALTATREPDLLYYALLFRGEAEQALGREAAAHEAYAQAIALFPRAQSPRLAQSLLARRSGDRQAGMSSLLPVLTLPADYDARYDPWWSYYLGRGSVTDALLTRLWSPFAARQEQ